MNNKSRLFALIAAVSLAGCGGGSDVSVGSPSLPDPGSGTQNPALNNSNPSSGDGGSSTDSFNSQEALSRQFSGTISRISGEVVLAQQSDQSEEVYDPNTESSLATAFTDAGVGQVVAGRTSSAFLIGDTTYGVGQAARDFLAGAGLARDAYTFLDIGEQGRTSRSAYLSTPENSIVNIMSSPLYISSQTDGLGGLIISPEDVQAHGWILSETGFDGNIDPIAGISSREWLGESGSKVAAGYRNALATGKVRLFYGLNVDGETRNNTSNGCQGVEQYCIGAPYSLRVKNSRGGYIDVDGTFVSTYGFAAYVMAWERMGAATHVREVFAIGDECTVDLGESGHDADTGRGRLDIGCLARKVYESQLPAEEADPVNPPSTQPAVQPVKPVVQPPVAPTVTVALNPPPVEQVAEDTTATVAVEPETETNKPVPVSQPPVAPTVTVALNPPPVEQVAEDTTATVAVEPETDTNKPVPVSQPPVAPTVTVALNPPPVEQVAEDTTATVAVEPETDTNTPVSVSQPPVAPTVTVVLNPPPVEQVSEETTATVAVEPETDTNTPVSVSQPPVAPTVTVALNPPPVEQVSEDTTATVAVEPDVQASVTVTTPPAEKENSADAPSVPEIGKQLPAEKEKPVYDKVMTSYWEGKIAPDTLGKEFKRLGFEDVTASRKARSHMIGHVVYRYTVPDPFEDWLFNYEYIRHSHNRDAAGNGWDFLKHMGLSEADSYTFTAVGGSSIENYKEDPTYDSIYRKTAENSMVHFETNPFYLGGPRFWQPRPWQSSRAWGMDKEIWLNSDLVPNHGWIVSETGFDVQYIRTKSWNNFNHIPLLIRDYRQASGTQEKFKIQAKKQYDKALATGKVRLFYGLNSNQTGRDPLFLDCTDFEEYCIGVPHPYNSYYAFGVYLKAWERLPEQAHISAVFAIGDRCTEDLGTKGPDADTGLGRLDIGCVAYEVYKVNLDSDSATLTVAARLPSSGKNQSDASELLDLQLQSAPQSFSGASSVDPSQQQFFDDFAQDLFSHLGSLWLPGGTDAGFAVGFPGDSFEGTYRPAHGKRTHYDFVVPSALYARSAGSIGLMGMASSGEVGIFTRIEGVDVSFSYARSEDFFGGSGSGDFSFDKVGNSRLMLHTQVLPEGDEHTLGVGGWVRHAAVSGGRGRLLDDLRGVEYGLSMNYGWQGQGGLRVEATAYGARFAGGEVELAGGDRFAIGASDWKWGVRFGGSYQF